jgi:hypothetical protein
VDLVEVDVVELEPLERRIDRGEDVLAVFGDPLETTWKNCIFGLCGVAAFHREVFAVVVTSTPEQRKCWLETVESTVDRYFSNLTAETQSTPRMRREKQNM